MVKDLKKLLEDMDSSGDNAVKEDLKNTDKEFEYYLSEKILEDMQDSICLDEDCEKVESEIWGRILYEDINRSLDDYHRYCKRPIDKAFHVSSEQQFLSSLKKSSCKYNPMCISFIGDYSKEELYNLTEESERQIKKAITQSIEQGYNIFVFGLFTEMELFAAEIILKYRETHPDIKIICATLYNTYELNCGFNEKEVMRSRLLLQQADYCKYFFDNQNAAQSIKLESLWEDNLLAYTWMVNISDKMIGVTRNPRTYTKCIFNYAKRKGVKVENWLYSDYDIDGTPKMNVNINDFNNINKTACFIGCYNDTAPYVKDLFDEEMYSVISKGYTQFIAGMASSYDLLAAEYILEKKDKNPDIKLICAVPYVGIEEQWSSLEKNLYNRILQRADLVKYISESYSPQCFKKHNIWLVDHSRMILSAYFSYHGGIRNSLKYAVKQRRIINNIATPLFFEYDC